MNPPPAGAGRLGFTGLRFRAATRPKGFALVGANSSCGAAHALRNPARRATPMLGNKADPGCKITNTVRNIHALFEPKMAEKAHGYCVVCFFFYTAAPFKSG
jgi:hypothetical protein